MKGTETLTNPYVAVGMCVKVFTCVCVRKWYFDEPSCGGEACVVMYHQPTALHGLGGAYMYQWNDDRCNMKHNFICKYEPGTQHHTGTQMSRQIR